ncbi:hypothetical protein [Streptomyces sp. NPDC059874]|uniref:hypothetical protein n=1 Tax=Streptomyces sp. NPDC059874 TaxID=3346983 RepID=UPI00365362C6
MDRERTDLTGPQGRAPAAEILRRWELCNVLRTLTALAAFVLLIVLALRGTAAGRGLDARQASSGGAS